MDADLSHDPKEIPKLLNPVKKGYDFSVGSRYIDGINVVNWPLKRILLSRMAAIYVRLITWMNIKDPTSGFVCYKSCALKKINIDKINSNGYAFQIETKFKLFSKRFKYVEVPIVFTDRKFGKSKLDSSIIGEAFIRVILIKLQSFFKLN
jgi:dolichol-phosphate mannosyltransferase